jgi:hypothetical protein
MAIAVVNKKQTGSAALSLLAITSAAKGNILVAFVSQTASTAEPSMQDSLLSGGWTFQATHAVSASSANSLWVATKEAVGGEVELKATPGAGGAVQGIAYFELSGCSTTTDGIVHTDNQASGKTITSPTLTTTDAGSIVLAGVGDAAAVFGSTATAIGAWTGTGPLTNIETTTTRCFGGSYLPGATISGTVTANWETGRTSGLLALALKPASTTTPAVVPLAAAVSSSSASAAVSASTRIALEAAGAASAGELAVTATAQVPLAAAAASSTASMAATATTQVALGAATATSGGSCVVSTPGAGVLVPLAAAAGSSSASAAVRARTHASLVAAVAASSAALVLQVRASAALAAGEASSTALGALSARALVGLQAASSTSTGSVTLSVSAPPVVASFSGNAGEAAFAAAGVSVAPAGGLAVVGSGGTVQAVSATGGHQ